ncbi:MAG: hypothetical protein GDA48_20410 [Hormoscilla sp. GM102CHS1]|nr:hypothetical protein [Hormoscilla sp. GM102CHS1]
MTPSLFPNAIYARTADGWAIALCSWLGAALAWHSLALYWGVRPPDLIVSIAIFLVMGAIAYRSSKGRNLMQLILSYYLTISDFTNTL